MIALALLVLTAAPSLSLAGDVKLGQETVERLLESAGGRKRWEALRSAVVKGRFDIGGAAGRYVETWTPDAHRVDLSLDCGATKSAVSSKNPWEREFNGDLWLDRPNAQAPKGRAAGEVPDDPPADPFDFMRWISEERVEATTATARGLDLVTGLSVKGVRPFELSTRDGLVVRMVSGTGVETSEASFGDYRTVAGLRIPYQQRFKDKYTVSSYSIDEVQIDPPLPFGLFEPESEMPAEAFAPVKLRLIQDGALWSLHGWLESPEEGGYFMIDTGLPMIVVADEAVPASAQRCPMHGFNLIGTGSQETQALVRLTDLHLGSFTISGLWALTVPLEAMSFLTEAQHRRILGILGNDVFRRFALKLDPLEKTLTVMPRATEPSERGFQWLPLRFDRSHPVVEARVSRRKGVFLADTGMSSTLLDPDFAAGAGLSGGKADDAEQEFVGIGGTETVRNFDDVTLRVGPLKRRGLRVGVRDQIDKEWDGILGHEVWDNAVSWWDYSRGVLGLKAVESKGPDFGQYAGELHRIQKMIGKQEGQRALEAVAPLRAKFPDRLEPLYYQIWAMHLIGRGDEAEDLFKEELARRPEDAGLRFLYVQYLRGTDHPGGLAVTARELLDHPDYQNDRYLLQWASVSLMASGFRAEGLGLARKAHRLYPRDADIRRLLGGALAANRLWSEAEPFLQETEPANPRGCLLLAQTRAGAGRSAEALKTLETCLSGVEANREEWKLMRDRLFMEPEFKTLRKSSGFKGFMKRLDARSGTKDL